MLNLMLQLEQTITLFLLYLSDNFFRSLSSPLNPLLLVTTLTASPLSQPGVSIDFGLNYSDIATHMLNEAGLRLWPLPVNVSVISFLSQAAVLMQLACLFLGDCFLQT